VKLTNTEFDAVSDLPDWRIMLGSKLEARFRASSYAKALDLISRIGAASDAANHHPDLDLRFPGHVHVTLTTHAVGGLTLLDRDLAVVISNLAADVGASSEPLGALRVEVGIDALDINLVRPFWKAVLGYRDGNEYQGTLFELVDPLGIGPAVWFQQMDEPRPQRNRVHLDVIVAHDVAEARLAAAIAAGGRLLNDEFAPAFWVLADPEGNEACICTWLNRD
jgi:4a-hydroxytetrahydrobiopterin dehydratase